MNTYDGFDGFMPPQRSRSKGEARTDSVSYDGDFDASEEAAPLAKAPEGERPIVRPDQDLLGRQNIVKRLALMLCASDRHASRRMTLGITGDWGVGKTSMLNLLELELGERRPRPIVVRFEPWLVTGLAAGHGRLVPDFFTTFAAVLGKERRYKEQAARAADLMRGYAQALSAHQSAGQSVNGAAQMPLVERRNTVAEALAKIDLPMVAIVDDVDSLDPADLRSLGQLIRGLADFERLSFVLAYDEARLTDNLGLGLPEQTALTRARAQLEKLVQMEVPVPGVSRGALVSMLEAELVSVFGVPESAARARMAADIRFQELVHSMLPGTVLKTPRDVKRVTGHVKSLAPVLQDRVDPVDVVGYCALAAKAPSRAADISLFPERYVVDAPEDFAAASKGFRTEFKGDPDIDGLVDFLFPQRFAAADVANLPRDRICLDACLAAVLRFGASTDIQTVSEVPDLPAPDPADDLMAAGSGEIARGLVQAVRDGESVDFINRLSAVYMPAGTEADQTVWKAILSGLKTLQADVTARPRDGGGLIGRLAALFDDCALRRPGFKAVRVLSLLIEGHEWNLSARILRSYWKRSRKRSGGLTGTAALQEGEIHNLAFQYAMHARAAHGKNGFLPRLISVAPVLLLIDLDVWDSEWRSGLQYALINDTAETSARLLDLIFDPDLDVGQSVRTQIVGNDQIVGHLAQLWARRARKKSSGAA